MKKIGIILSAMVMAQVSFAGELAQKQEEVQCNENGISYRHATIFLRDLQEAVRAEDKTKVAEMVSYPVRVNTTSSQTNKAASYYIKTKEDFVAKYPTMFDANKVKAILDEKEIFCNYQGAMIANGFIWFNGTKIVTVNE